MQKGETWRVHVEDRELECLGPIEFVLNGPSKIQRVEILKKPDL